MKIIAWLLAVSGVAFGLFTIVFGIIGPDQDIHAVHNAVVASLLLVLTAPPMIAVARAPERAIRPLVILGALAIAGLAAMALALTPDPFILPVLILIGVLWWLAPSRDGVIPQGRASLAMGALVCGRCPLVPYAIEHAALQRTDHVSAHAAFYHWVERHSRRLGSSSSGWRSPAPGCVSDGDGCAGPTLAILGAASVLFADHASALASPWSWAALIGGLAFVVFGEMEARRSR